MTTNFSLNTEQYTAALDNDNDNDNYNNNNDNVFI